MVEPVNNDQIILSLVDDKLPQVNQKPQVSVQQK